MRKILVIGSTNTDMVVKVPRIPSPGETILGGVFLQAAGGKGANQAVAAARNGGDVIFIASIGNDSLGKDAVQGFKKDGINTDYIFTDSNSPSGVALILVDELGENSIAVASGANSMLSPEKIKKTEQIISEAEVLLMQLEIPLATIEFAARIGKANGVQVILNPAPAQPLSNELLKNIDIITPNQTEAELLTDVKVIDEKSAEEAASILLSKGVNTVIITLGPKGAFVMNSKLKTTIPGFKLDAIDSTAAGDTFNGVLAVELARGKEMKEAIKYANAAAAISVTRLGAQESIPKYEEIIQFIDKSIID